MRLSRSVLALALVLSGAVCVCAAEPVADQAAGVAAVKALGGKVKVDEKAAGSPVVGVDLGDTKMTDDNIALLEALPGIRTLSLRHGYKLTDAAVGHLKGLTQLQSLDVWDFKITDAGLEGLKGCTEIQTLNLGGTAVSSAGMAKLKQFPKLQTLVLQYTKVGDEGMKYLQELPQLQSLNISLSAVTDKGLSAVGEMKQLQTLYLPGAITDAGVVELKGLTGLHELGLRGTKVTDAGLGELGGLTELRKLDVVDTKVTDEGVKKLQEALPKCRIQRK